MGETGGKQRLTVGNATGYQADGDMTTARMLQNAKGQLAHQRLAVGSTLTGDDQVG